MAANNGLMSASPRISEADLRAHVIALSSEVTDGRLAGSPGERIAAGYVARGFRAIGLSPGGDSGTFYQDFGFTAGISLGNDNVLETSLPVRGKGPARRPGIWQVRLWHDGRLLVNRSFEIHKAAETAMSAGASFAGLAYCGPSRWSDPVISTRNSVAVASGRPGAWVGGELLDVAGPTYSSVVLLTGCAPG